MKALLCILISYVIGTINPSYIIARFKGLDIRTVGSKNAGASNALIVLGKLSGAVCMLFDIAKACFAIWLCQKLFPDFEYALVLAGVFCLIGHVFPFYMKFKGGKGLACLGGLLIMMDWRLFFIILAIEIVIALIVNYIFIVPITASVAMPILYGFMTNNVWNAVIMLLATIIIYYKHMENFKRVKAGTEMKLSYLWNKDKELERIQNNNK